MVLAKPPSAVTRATSAPTSCAEPVTTHCSGDAYTATCRVGRSSVIRPRSGGGRSTTAMVPPRTVVRSRDREATIRAPVGASRAPAVTAAAISPSEWPITAEGSAP